MCIKVTSIHVCISIDIVNCESVRGTVIKVKMLSRGNKLMSNTTQRSLRLQQGQYIYNQSCIAATDYKRGIMKSFFFNRILLLYSFSFPSNVEGRMYLSFKYVFLLIIKS